MHKKRAIRIRPLITQKYKNLKMSLKISFLFIYSFYVITKTSKILAKTTNFTDFRYFFTDFGIFLQIFDIFLKILLTFLRILNTFLHILTKKVGQDAFIFISDNALNF